MSLPQEFTTYTSQLFGQTLWQQYLDAFTQTPPVSVRINPFKPITSDAIGSDAVAVPWCANAYWLPERPQFTFDPLFHAGTYYVQEAGSMFLDHVLRTLLPTLPPTGTCLDLCAAPGGKSTLLRAVLPDGWQLYCNEPDRRRANILMENIQKQGHPRVIVTNNYPIDYHRSRLLFDLILTDVPCSGEGLFRRDPSAVSEWSTQNVHRCAQLQRDILTDIWPSLKPGGTLIYSTCTFNVHEDEENVRWIADELGADIIPVSPSPDWHITGSLLPDWHQPVYRFIPGVTQSEGLFVAVLRKHLDTDALDGKQRPDALHVIHDGTNLQPATRPSAKADKRQRQQRPAPEQPSHAEALSISATTQYPHVEVSRDLALAYLHRETITLPPDTPRGFVIITYQGHPLGFVKNIGTRANNLYPKEWAIRGNIKH